MKKLILVSATSLAFLFLLAGQVGALACYNPSVPPTNPPSCEAGKPCHIETKDSLVPCGQYNDCRCDLADVFVMLRRLYVFMIWYIGLPLAGLLIVAGGVLILLSGLNPKFYDTGKTMLWGAFWGITLMLCSYLIVDVVLRGLGYTGVWSRF